MVLLMKSLHTYRKMGLKRCAGVGKAFRVTEMLLIGICDGMQTGAQVFRSNPPLVDD